MGSNESVYGKLEVVPAERNECCHKCGYPFDQGERVYEVVDNWGHGKVYCSETCLLTDVK